MKFKLMTAIAIVTGYFALFVERTEAQSDFDLFAKASFGLGVVTRKRYTSRIMPHASVNIGDFFHDLTGVYIAGSYGCEYYSNELLRGYGIGIIRFTNSTKNGPYVYTEVSRLYEDNNVFYGHRGGVGGGFKFDRYFSVNLSLTYGRGSGDEYNSIYLTLSAWTF